MDKKRTYGQKIDI